MLSTKMCKTTIVGAGVTVDVMIFSPQRVIQSVGNKQEWIKNLQKVLNLVNHQGYKAG